MKRLIFLISILVVVFVSCKKKETDNTITPVKKTYKISYEIGCTDCQVIYYSDSLQTQVSEDHKNNSWTYTFYGKKGQEVLLFAYNLLQKYASQIKIGQFLSLPACLSMRKRELSLNSLVLVAMERGQGWRIDFLKWVLFT